MLHKHVSNTLTSGKNGSVMLPVKRYQVVSHTWHHQPQWHLNQGNEGHHSLFQSPKFHYIFSPRLYQIPSQCSLSHYHFRENPSLIFYLFTNIRSIKTGTPIRSQTGRKKRSSLHLSRHGDVEVIRVNKYRLHHLSVLCSK